MLLDLSYSVTTVNAINKFEEQLHNNDYNGRSINVALGRLVFTPGHMARLKTLAGQNNVEIDTIYSFVVQTQLAALGAGLKVSEIAPGEKILQDFKASLKNMDEESSLVKNQLQEESCQRLVPEEQESGVQINFNQENVSEPVSEKPQGPIFSTTNASESDYKIFNDVVEILNDEDIMLQQKIELPFEKKVELSEQYKSRMDDKVNEEIATLYIHQTLRSGQVITHQGNIVIAGDTHPGSEIIAGGDIIVWGTLGGIAHAGAGGNYKSSIRALKLNAIQIRIADYIARRPDINREMIKEIPLKPEVARISNGEIRIFSLK